MQLSRSREVMAGHPATSISSPVSVMRRQYFRIRVVMAGHGHSARLASPAAVMLQHPDRSRVVIAGHPAAKLASPVSVIA